MTRLFITILILVTISCGPSRKKSKQEILEDKAEYYYKKKIYKEAIPYFDQLISIDSTKGEYYSKRGYSCGRLFYFKAAYSDFQKAIELKYNLAETYFDIALICSESYNDSLALIYYDKLLQIDSSNSQGIHILMKISKERMESLKNDPDMWKEFEDYLQRNKQN